MSAYGNTGRCWTSNRSDCAVVAVSLRVQASSEEYYDNNFATDGDARKLEIRNENFESKEGSGCLISTRC
jgi:hypothetical protein